MANPETGAIPKETLQALNQAVFSFLSVPGSSTTGLPAASVQAELATLSGHYDVTVSHLFNAACKHHQLDVAAASLAPDLVVPMHPVVATSPGLAGMDMALGKSSGFSVRALLRSVAESTESVSRPALASIAVGMMKAIGQKEPNVVVKNGLRELSLGVKSVDSNAYRLVRALRGLAELEPSAPPVMAHLDSAMLASLMSNDYDEDARALYLSLDQADSGSSALTSHSFTSRLAESIKLRLDGFDFGDDEHAIHLIQLLLDTDGAMTAFRSKLFNQIQQGFDATDGVGIAIEIGRLHLNNVSYEKHFNEMDPMALAAGLKTRELFEMFSVIPGIDLDRLDKRQMTVEALGGLFSSELGL